MFSKTKDLNKYIFNVKRTGKGSQPNQGAASPLDANDEARIKSESVPIRKKFGTSNLGTSPNNQLCTFKRNMIEKEVKRELFILEGEEIFNDLSLRAKMTLLIKRSSLEIRDWYYDLGMENMLPESWESFKSKVIEYCCCLGIDSTHKFYDEAWSQYVLRLTNISKQYGIDEAEVLKKLRNENSPKILQTIFYAFNVTLEDVLNRVIEYENYNQVNKSKFIDRRHNENKESNLNRQFDEKKANQERNKDKVRCYKCRQFGHYSNECTGRNSSLNNVKVENLCRIDTKGIKLENMAMNAVFDTGASSSIITSKALRKLGKVKRNLENEEFKLINGNKVRVKESTILKTEYNGKCIDEKYYIIKNDVDDTILICNNAVKELNNNIGKKVIPFECAIDTGNIRPISWTRPLQSYINKKDFEDLIDELERKGVLEESTSDWLNPVHLVRKKTGKLRFCVDFRRLNDAVLQDNYEIPKIQEVISTLYDAKYFTGIDLKDGFFQIKIRNEDKKKTAFFTGTRLMQFRRMPQGFKNSPAIFQRTMNYVLKGLVNKICVVYIDDILIFGKTEQEHDENLNKVIVRLKEYGLEENLEKRQYKKENIAFLGYEISHNKIKPAFSRCQGIQDFKVPKTKKELQRFLGMLNYDRNFIKNLSTELKPLYKLLEKNIKFIWTDKENEIFEELKNKWVKELELRIPNPEKQYTLETDASNIGIGAVLSQDNRPVAYISRVLNKAEVNYGITEKEALAVIWATEKLQYYLLGNKFNIVTDHKALETLKSKADFGSARIRRWLEKLSRFDYYITYKPGCQVEGADALSRAHLVMENLDKRYEDILRIHKKLNHRINIKNDLKKIGVDAKQKEIRNVINRCKTCSRNDKIFYKSSQFIETSRPGERVAFDILEINKGRLVLLGIDFFSRTIFGTVLKSKDSGRIVKEINEIYKIFKFKELQTDNGREFANVKLAAWCKNNKVNHITTVPYYHQSNGRIERANRTIRTAIKKTRGRLQDTLPDIINNYNKAYHRALGMTPDEALDERNHEKIKKHEETYKKEFKQQPFKTRSVDINDEVYIRNETKNGKMDLEYRDKGKVIKCIGKNTFKILKRNGKELIRHRSQLKPVGEGDVVSKARM